MTYTLRIAFALSLLIAVAMPHNVLAQTTSITAGCYTRNYDGSRGTLVGQPVNGECPPDSSGNSTYAYGANGLPGTAGSGNLKYVLLEPLSVTQSAPEDFCGVLSLLFKLLIYFGGMLAVLYLVLGGIGFMVSEVANKRTVARQRIQGALWGLAILLSSWVILNTLNPKLINACSLLAPYQSNAILPSPTPIPASTTTSPVPYAPIEQSIQDCASRGGVLKTLAPGETYAGPGGQALCTRHGYTSCAAAPSDGTRAATLWCAIK